jgi:hypothetical protein
MVAVPARPRTRHLIAWILPVVAGVGTWIALLWLWRPTWGYCVDGAEAASSYCDSGVHSLGAQIGSVGLGMLLVAFVVLALTLRGPRRRAVLIGSIVVLGIACIAAAGLVFTPLEDVPMRIVE